MKESIEIRLPKLGESIVSATVVQWFKSVGDRVELDEPLLEVSTDKINSEIPSPAAGILLEVLAQPGQELPVGGLLAILSSSSVAVQSLPRIVSEPALNCSNNKMDDFLSPSVIRLLQERGLKREEIDQIPRTGRDGRLTKRDVEEYVARPISGLQGGEVERIRMTPLRMAIADNMVRSFYEAPHASLLSEVDVTRLGSVIQEHRESFLEKHGSKLSVTAFVARAIAKSLEAFPLLNASLDGDTIVMKRSVNLGIAVSVDQGVVVPVIRGCQRLSLPTIACQIAEMAEKARTKKLSPIDVQDGTVTMTNFGMTGTMVGIPIIRHPEVAIVGLGAIVKKVVVLPGDLIAIRSMMWVTLTFDHRVLDGLYGCGFLGELKRCLEEDTFEV